MNQSLVRLWGRVCMGYKNVGIANISSLFLHLSSTKLHTPSSFCTTTDGIPTG